MNGNITIRTQKVKRSHTKLRLCVFLGLVIILMLVALFSEQLTPYDPYE